MREGKCSGCDKNTIIHTPIGLCDDCCPCYDHCPPLPPCNPAGKYHLKPMRERFDEK